MRKLLLPKNMLASINPLSGLYTSAVDMIQGEIEPADVRLVLIKWLVHLIAHFLPDLQGHNEHKGEVAHALCQLDPGSGASRPLFQQPIRPRRPQAIGTDAL